MGAAPVSEGRPVADGPAATLEDCRKLIAAGRVRESLAALETLLAADPESGPVLHHYAVALHLSGRSEEAMPYFDHALEYEPGQANIHQNRSIALLALGRTEEAIASAREAVRLRPGNPGGYVNLVLAECRAGRYADAWETVSKGLEAAPDHPGLLNQAAHIATEARNFSLAGSFVERALAVAPDNPEAVYNSGILHQARSRYEDALRAYDRTLALQPGHQGAFVNRGVVLRQIGRIGEAVAQFRKGLAQAPDWPVLRYNLALTELLVGRWERAWPDFELRTRFAGALDRSPRPDSPVWDGGDIAGRTLLVIHEQGLGDTLQFLRFLPFARERAGRLVFMCQERLHALLLRLDLFRSGDIELVPSDAPVPPHDLHVPLMSLARLYGATPGNLPRQTVGIALEEPRLSRWAAFGRQDPEQWRIGLSWQGDPGASVDQDGSMPPAALAPLGALAGRAAFLSLEKHLGHDQSAPEGLDLLMPPTDFDGGRDAFIDSAALMMSLDLVVTTDTTVAHLAGLLGRPVWLLLTFVPDWRWGLEGLLTPWYPTMRIFRQRAPGDWEGVVAEVVAQLDRLIGDGGEGGPVSEETAGEAVRLHEEGRFAEARALYDSMVRHRRRNPQMQNFHAMAILEEGRRGPSHAERALPMAAHSVALDPARSELWSNFAVLLDSLGRPDDSRRALRFALDAEPDHIPSLIALAKKELAAGKAEGALAVLREVLMRAPDSAPAHSAMAAALTDLKRHREAEEAVRKALGIEPKNARLWVQLGAIQSDAGRPRNAADSWERALAADPGNADAFSNLGVNERNHGEIEIACWFGCRAVECDPRHAEAWNNLGVAELEAGRGDNAVAAFRKAIEIRPDLADALSKLAGGDLSQLHVKAPPEGAAVRPFDPGATFNAALKAHRAGDDAAATRLFSEALKSPRLKPAALNMLGVIALHADRNHRAAIFFEGAEKAGLQSPELLTNHAISLRRIGAIPEAIAKLNAVISRAPTPESHLTLANIYRDECAFELSLANYEAALRLKPDFPKAHRGIGNLMRDMHRPEESLAAFERARALDPKDPDLVLDHAHAKLFAGDLIGGFRDYEARWQSKEMRPRHFAEPRWKGETAPGKVLLIHGEQGFGDNIQFVRFVDEAARRVGRVVLKVRGPLVELMRRLETERPLTVVEQGTSHRFDLQVPMLSLPMAFGTTLDTIPPPARFRLDPERVALWRERFPSGGMKVGLVWQGNPRARADAGRSPPFAALAPLFSLPGTHFVALQKTDGLDQLQRSEFAGRIVAPGEALGDFSETAHAIAALDVVVSSCTATLHLAASLGLPVYGMLKYHADWRWLNEMETSPWYPSLRLFRQQKVHDWEPVVAAVRAALAERTVAA